MPLMEGFARRFLALKGGKNPTEARFTFQESIAMAQVEPPGFEMTRAGRRQYLAWNGTAPTGIAPVQALPTTAAQWAITNNDTVKTHHYLALGAFPISGTPGVGGILLACIFQTPAQTGFATGVAVTNGSNSSIGSKAAVKSGVTITVPTAPLWFPVAFNQPGAAGAGVAGNQILNTAVEGRVSVQPGFSLGLAVLALAGTTPLFLPIAEWIEQETDME
jgi:hypothetical protein